MKRVLLITLILSTFQGFSQKSKWITYFPAQDDIIGQMVLGNKASELTFVKNTQINVELEKYKSYDVLDRKQKKSLKLKFSDYFALDRVKVSNVYAKNIHIDRIKAEQLGNIAPGNEFVFSGMRADSVSIFFEKERNIDANPQKIAKKITELFPNLNTLQIENLIAEEIKDSTKTTMKLTISDPNVYFMIETAKIKLNKSKSVIGNEYVDAFGKYDGNCDKEIDKFTLDGSNPVSCSSIIEVPNSSGGSEIGLTLKVSNGKLYISHQTADLKDNIDQEIVFDNTRLVDNLGRFIYRYPFNTKGNKIKFKEVYLLIDVKKTNDGFEIFNKAGKHNYPTRLSSPTSKLEISKWRQ
jgi:hypothetical protein